MSALESSRVTSPDAPLLGTYDRLRTRVTATLARRPGRVGTAAADVLLLVPDVFILLARLVLDREVPVATRRLAGGALAYFLLPLDLFPEAVLGAGGFLEDVVLAALVLTHVLSRDLEPLIERHWSGPDRLRIVVRDLAQGALVVLGPGLYQRVRKLLARRGVELADDGEAARPQA